MNYKKKYPRLSKCFNQVNDAFLIKVCELLDAPISIYRDKYTVVKRTVSLETYKQLDKLCAETTKLRAYYIKEINLREELEGDNRRHWISENVNWCKDVLHQHFSIKVE